MPSRQLAGRGNAALTHLSAQAQAHIAVGCQDVRWQLPSSCLPPAAAAACQQPLAHCQGLLVQCQRLCVPAAGAQADAQVVGRESHVSVVWAQGAAVQLLRLSVLLGPAAGGGAATRACPTICNF